MFSHDYNEVMDLRKVNNRDDIAGILILSLALSLSLSLSDNLSFNTDIT
jgi:hypothetical protein